MNNSNNIDNILNNPELGNLFNNVIKSINHNITQNINEDENSDIEDIETETEFDINEETPISLVLQKLLTDKNGNNIADILSKLSDKIDLLTK